MRTTLNLDEKLYQDVAKATGVVKKTRLIHMGLEELLRKAAYEKLARLRGACKKAKVSPRRKIV